MPAASSTSARARLRLAGAITCASAAAIVLAACGTAVSTSGFSGESHAVAQAIADFQSAATATEQKKICTDHLAAPLVRALGGQSGCERGIKGQLSEVDNFELSVASIKVNPATATATASVKSTYTGKKATHTITLRKEGGRWRVSGLG